MIDYLQLAQSIAHVTAKHLPDVPMVVVHRKCFPSDHPKRRRERYLKMRANRKPTAYSIKYGTLRIKMLFPAIAEELGISEDNARVRYYRGQVPVAVLKLAKRKASL
jgi:hypothetical protein